MMNPQRSVVLQEYVNMVVFPGYRQMMGLRFKVKPSGFWRYVVSVDFEAATFRCFSISKSLKFPYISAIKKWFAEMRHATWTGVQTNIPTGILEMKILGFEICWCILGCWCRMALPWFAEIRVATWRGVQAKFPTAIYEMKSWGLRFCWCILGCWCRMGLPWFAEIHGVIERCLGKVPNRNM